MDCVVEKSSRLSTQGSASWNDDVRNCSVARGFDLAGLAVVACLPFLPFHQPAPAVLGKSAPPFDLFEGLGEIGT